MLTSGNQTIVNTFYDLVDRLWTPFEGFKVEPAAARSEVEWLLFNLQCGSIRRAYPQHEEECEWYLWNVIGEFENRGAPRSVWADNLR